MREFLIIILAVLAISCGRNYKFDNCMCNYAVSVAPNIGITEREAIAAVSSVLKETNSGRYLIEIVIFSYSSGKEVFSYPENNPDKMNIKTFSGNISALLKFKQEKVLQKVIFLEAEGNGKEEILRGLAKEIQRAVCEN
jgi:hypothetical protein